MKLIVRSFSRWSGRRNYHFAARTPIGHRPRNMPRSLASRSLEPLVAILWGLFLMWTAWLAVVWIGAIGPSSLGLGPGDPTPPNADLRRAVLLMAQHADVAWFALALMNLHLVVMNAHGLATARLWLALCAGGAFMLGLVNARIGIPFGWLSFGEALGAAPFGVAIGWVLLSAVLVLAGRGAVLWARPRASHSRVTILTAAVVLATMFNLESPARVIRAWWFWHTGITRAIAPVPWMNWAAWFAWPLLAAFAMRENDVVSGVAARSVKPALILALLNAIALAARVRMWMQG